MLPESVLDSWQAWSCDLSGRPHITAALSGGRSNRSYLLTSSAGKLVLRINGSDAAVPGAARTAEADIWRAASDAGIAAPLLYADPAGQFLVSRFIESSLPATPPFDQAWPNLALDLLSRCHQLDVEAPVLDYQQHIRHYCAMIGQQNPPAGARLLDRCSSIELLIDELLANGQATGLCHHDPVTGNFVGNRQRLYLIDWEYASYGLPIMDYAGLVIEWQLDQGMVSEVSGFDADSLSKAKRVYRYLCDLWAAIS